MLASTLRSLKEERDLSLRCPACGSGWTSIFLDSVSAAGPLFACTECTTRFFERQCHEESEAVPSGPKSEDSVYWEAQMTWLRGLCDSAPERILDIGCGEGEFLSEWPAGVQKVGMEPDQAKAAVANAKGIQTYRADEEKPFDIVTCYDVLSRSAYSSRVFALFPNLVASGGLAAIQIPTFESHAAYMAHQAGRAWTIYNSGERTTYFSRKFLQAKFEALGFARARATLRIVSGWTPVIVCTFSGV